MGRAKVVSDFVKRHDRLLYCESRDGKLCIYRKSQRIESYEIDNVTIHFVRPAPYFVCALTENWSMDAEPRDWGLLPILERLQFLDLWNRDLVREIREQDENKRQSRDRALDNHLEAYLKDHRREFAKATNDIRTSNMENTDKRKTGEKNGYC